MKAFFIDEEWSLNLSSEGYFKSDALPICEATLILSSGLFDTAFNPSKVELADLRIRPGINEIEDIDVTKYKPGSIRVFASRDGVPLANHVVVIKSVDSHAWSRAMTHTDGTTVVNRLFPGDWRIVIRQFEEGGWKYVDPEPISIVSGKQSECKVDVHLVQGKVRILDAATGAPVVNHRLLLTYPDDRTESMKTDSEGWLELTLGIGSYSLSAYPWNKRELHKEALIWTAIGPVSESVKFKVP